MTPEPALHHRKADGHPLCNLGSSMFVRTTEALERVTCKVCLRLLKKHTCYVPAFIVGGFAIQQPDWTCGVCGRVWRHEIYLVGGGQWAEVRGASNA